MLPSDAGVGPLRERTMIFMSQSGITDPAQQAAWGHWYQGHLAVMLTVNGIESAQRFTLIEGVFAPSLALYTITSPAVFQDAYYLRIRGMGPWLPLLDQRYYRRTLFAGLDIAPVVSDTDVLLVTDGAQPEPALGGIAWTWLEAVALDRAPRFRGLAVVSHADARHTLEAGIASYQPVTAQLRPERG
jgi:hypothetical protein